MAYYSRFPKYTSVAERKAKALKKFKTLKKKGLVLNPVSIEGRVIAKTFWGKAWCKHLETFQDYDHRLPRGRSCLRAGAVIDLVIQKGLIKGLVVGSSNYTVTVHIDALPEPKWVSMLAESSGKINSIVALLQGIFPKEIMEKMTNVQSGLFPDLQEVNIHCSCPDWSKLCKHAAAVLYAVGNRLDYDPDNLFTLRSVNHLELLQTNVLTSFIDQQPSNNLEGDLSSIFNIELVEQKP